jgi:hypothetical protein
MIKLKEVTKNLFTILNKNPDFEKLGMENLAKIYNQKYYDPITKKECQDAFDYIMFGTVMEPIEGDEDFEFIKERRYAYEEGV